MHENSADFLSTGGHSRLLCREPSLWAATVLARGCLQTLAVCARNPGCVYERASPCRRPLHPEGLSAAVASHLGHSAPTLGNAGHYHSRPLSPCLSAVPPTQLENSSWGSLRSPPQSISDPDGGYREGPHESNPHSRTTAVSLGSGTVLANSPGGVLRPECRATKLRNRIFCPQLHPVTTSDPHPRRGAPPPYEGNLAQRPKT